MTSAHLLDLRAAASRGVHLGIALRTSAADTASADVDPMGPMDDVDTLDGVLTSIEVWDHGALVAYREATASGQAS